MNLTQMFDEIKKRTEKIKDEILEEIVNSKTVNQIVSNKNFVKAVSSVIETKQEIQKTLNHQVKALIHKMQVATKRDLSSLVDQLQKVEKKVEAKIKKGKKSQSSKKKKSTAKKKKSTSSKKKKTTKKKKSTSTKKKAKPSKKKSTKKKTARRRKK